MNKQRYVIILFDRETNAQITATFNDINSIDQVPPGLVRALKQYNESKGPKIDTSTNVEAMVQKMLRDTE